MIRAGRQRPSSLSEKQIMEMLQISLAGVQGELEISLQHTIDIVKFGLTAAEEAIEKELAYPGSTIGYSTAAKAMLSFPEAKYRFHLWTLTNGMRDAVEIVSAFLETARSACAATMLVAKTQSGSKRELSILDWNSQVQNDARKFHKLGLPDKIEHFGTKYSKVLIPESTAEIKSINQGRNCLVHRRGIVTDIDLTTPDGLLIQWNKLQLLAEGPWGTCKVGRDGKIIDDNGVPQLADQMMVRIDKKEKLFSEGDAILFDAEEFSDICFTCMLFGNQLVSKISDYAISQGLSLNSPITFA